MTFTGAGDKQLPAYVKKLDRNLQAKWVAVYNRIELSDSKEMAIIAANRWLLKQGTKKTTVARTANKVERVVFTLEKGPEFIKRTSDGEDYVSFKLASVGKDAKGKTWKPELLEKWSKGINEGNYILGDIDHNYYDKLLESNLTESEIKEHLKNKPSIAKSMQAVFEKGVLWVRALIDKRYRKSIEKSQGVSLEALVETDDHGNVLDGDLLGFTFGVNDTPVFEGTGVQFHGASA